MPYSIEELKSKPSYQNIVDADKNEQKKFFEDEEIKAQQSGSTLEAVQTLRDADGFILSYEDPDNLGKTMPSSIQKVRLPMEYINTVDSEIFKKLGQDRKFSDFRPKLVIPAPIPVVPLRKTEEQGNQTMADTAAELRDQSKVDDDAELIADATGTTPENVKLNSTAVDKLI